MGSGVFRQSMKDHDYDAKNGDIENYIHFESFFWKVHENTFHVRDIWKSTTLLLYTMNSETEVNTEITAESMKTATWQALPPRRRARRSDIRGSGGDAQARKRQTIEDNVQERATKAALGSWAKATLEGRDGCAGEFYEYLDHTADVQCHSWGPTLEAAFEAMAPCMFNYMTDLSLITEQPAAAVEFVVHGHDLKALLYNYMDELLFRFCTDGLCVKRVHVLNTINVIEIAPVIATANIPHDRDIEGDAQTDAVVTSHRDTEALSSTKNSLTLHVRAHGCLFDRSLHIQGTEIKAITYSNMQIHHNAERSDLYVIVDI